MPLFNPLDISLKGKHLIEASAGTGKTYSIGILVLRLLLEAKVPIEKILLITFTVKATNELKLRIRKFLQVAMEYTEVPPSDGSADLIYEVVKKVGETSAKEILQKAILDLDKAQISTIHSFLHLTANRFAFETKQQYSKDIVEEFAVERKRVVEKHLLENAKTPNGITDLANDAIEVANQMVKKSLEGRQFYYDPENHPEYPQNAHVKQDADWVKFTNAAVEDIKAAVSERNVLSYQSLTESLHAARNNPELIKLVRDTFQAVFVDEFQDTDRLQYEIIRDLFDTDHTDNRVFYIADPRQIIYAWRNADLEAYLQAKNAVSDENCYYMEDNYRCNNKYLDALNSFYAGLENVPYDGPFFHSQVSFTRMNAAGPNKDDEGLIRADGNDFPALSAVQDNGEGLYKEMVEAVCSLLGGKFQLNGAAIRPEDIGILVRGNKDAGTLKKLLQAKSIPVLQVEGNSIFATSEAEYLKEMLEAVLNPGESQILKMLINPAVALETNACNSADLNALVLKTREFRTVWEQEGLWKMLEQFLDYVGISRFGNCLEAARLSMLSNFRHLAELLEDRARQNHLSPPEVLEFLSGSMRATGQNTPDDFKIRSANDRGAVHIGTIHSNKGLEYPIVLVFVKELKSEITNQKKGAFQYNENNQQYFGRKLTTGRNNFTVYKNAKGKGEQQQLQENARLVYVALTRAKYATLVFCGASVNAPNIDNFKKKLFETYLGQSPLPVPNLTPAEGNLNIETPKICSALPFPDKGELHARKYFKMSYSFLARELSHVSRPLRNTYDDAAYDAFAFHQLKRGKRTGEMLHQIFEYIDFQQPADWEEKISAAIVRHNPVKKGDAQYAQHLKTLINHTLQVALPLKSGEVRLASLDRSKRIQELEFDFPVPKVFDSGSLEDIFGDDDSRRIYAYNGKYAGMMNGVLDMLFESNGRYYILDWKSNYLGDTLEDYEAPRLEIAMNESNYHLQYLLYTAALDRFLKFKLGAKYDYESHFGGVIYLFLRGIREGRSEGIYYTDVPAETLHRLQEILDGEAVEVGR